MLLKTVNEHGEQENEKWESRVLPLSMRYASLAFRTLSLLDFMSSSEISVMSLAQ